MAKEKNVTIKLIKSTIGCSSKQKLCVRGLGLRKLNHSITLKDTPEVRGMIDKVSFLLLVE